MSTMGEEKEGDEGMPGSKAEGKGNKEEGEGARGEAEGGRIVRKGEGTRALNHGSFFFLRQKMAGDGVRRWRLMMVTGMDGSWGWCWPTRIRGRLSGKKRIASAEAQREVRRGTA